MTTHTLLSSLTDRAARTHGVSWTAWLRRLLNAVESRRHLAEMDRRMLADIGVSRAEALQEASRAPWDLTPPRR